MKALLGFAKELSTINEAQSAGLINIAQKNELAAQAYQTHIASVNGLKASTISTATAMNTGAVSAKQFAAGAGAIGVGSKAAAIGMKALSIAANMLFNMAITMVITALISGIQKLANASKEAAEQAQEALEKYKETAKAVERLRPVPRVVEARREGLPAYRR